MGEPLIKKVFGTVPTSRCRKASLEILSTFENLHLQIDDKADGVYFGDIISKEGNHNKSLRSELIQADILEEAKETFNGKCSSTTGVLVDFLIPFLGVVIT